MTNGSDLTKQDLFLLLDSYKNTVELNTTLLEQIKKLLEVVHDIEDLETESVKKKEEIVNQIISLASKITENQTSLTTLQSKLEAKFLESKIDIIKEVGKIKLLIYGAYSGMIMIIIGLIGLICSLIDRFSLLKEIILILKEIGKKLGVQL